MLLMTTTIDWDNNSVNTTITEVVDVVISLAVEKKVGRKGLKKYEYNEILDGYIVTFTDIRGRKLQMEVSTDEAAYIEKQLFESGKIDLRTEGKTCYRWSLPH